MVRDWAVLEIREDDSREEKRALPVEHGHRRRGRRGGGGGTVERDLPFLCERGDYERRRRYQGELEESVSESNGKSGRAGGDIRERVRRRGQN